MIEEDENYLEKITKDCKLIIKFDDQNLEFDID